MTDLKTDCPGCRAINQIHPRLFGPGPQCQCPDCGARWLIRADGSLLEAASGVFLPPLNDDGDPRGSSGGDE